MKEFDLGILVERNDGKSAFFSFYTFRTLLACRKAAASYMLGA